MPSVNVPKVLNQRSITPSALRVGGCALCCIISACSFFGNKTYTTQDMITAEVCTSSSSYILSWDKAPSASFTKILNLASQDKYREKIVSEIDLGNPIMVHYGDHFVLAYGYTYGGTSNSNISVWDPYNKDSDTDTYGVDIALSTSMSNQGTPDALIDRLETITSK